jgi:hypothetical protein
LPRFVGRTRFYMVLPGRPKALYPGELLAHFISLRTSKL